MAGVAPKTCATYVLGNDTRCFRESLASVVPYVDAVFCIINKVAFNGDLTDTTQVRNILNIWAAAYKVEIKHLAETKNEQDTRNMLMDWIKEEGYQYALIVDNDEVWEKASAAIKYAHEHPAAVYSLQMYTYWKTPEYRIDPPETIQPAFIVQPGKFRFSSGRAVALNNGEKKIQIPFGTVHHYSYVGTDLEIKNKIRRFSHSSQVQKDWYEEKWLKWHPAMEDLHPTSPACYKKAIKVEVSDEIIVTD